VSEVKAQPIRRYQRPGLLDVRAQALRSALCSRWWRCDAGRGGPPLVVDLGLHDIAESR